MPDKKKPAKQKDQELAAGERARLIAIRALSRPGCEALIRKCMLDPHCTPAIAAIKIRDYEKSPIAVARRVLASYSLASLLPARAPSRAGVQRILTAHEMVTHPWPGLKGQ